jgi:hypothetical protein
VLPVLQAHRVIPVHRVLLAILARKAHKVCRVYKVPQALRVHKAYKA